MISFVVPAHNEEAVIGRTLAAINDSAHAIGKPFEIIVVNDASTDSTAAIAHEHGATVVQVNNRQIAATRNAGARVARGDRFFFIDADTTINPQAVASALHALDKGAVGGGATVCFDGVLPLYARLLAFILGIFGRLIGFTGGAFMFCTREAFQASGGFNERLFCGEEGPMALALKRQGRFVILWEHVETSGRRFRTMSGLQILGLCLRLASSSFKALTQRSSVEKIWYDSNRDNDNIMPNSFAVRLSNAVALVIFIVLLTGPIWNFIPRSLTPLASPVGKIRFLIAIFLNHVGLILFWPCALALFGSLIRQKPGTEWIKLAALFAFCFWQAWTCTHSTIQIWTRVFHWFAA